MSDDARPKRKPPSAEAAAKGLAKARLTNHKPAGGGPRMGAGWGGPAMGASTTAGDTTAARAAPRRTPEERMADADRALEKILKIMDTAPEVSLQLMAAVHARNQIIGTPTARTIVADAADDEAVKVIERRIVDKAVDKPKT